MPDDLITHLQSAKNLAPTSYIADAIQAVIDRLGTVATADSGGGGHVDPKLPTT